MNIFDLQEKVLQDYSDFINSFILISDERAESFVRQALGRQGNLIPEPLIQLSPAYAQGKTVEELVKKAFFQRKSPAYSETKAVTPSDFTNIKRKLFLNILIIKVL